MDIMTATFINFQRYVRGLNGDGDENLGLGCDGGEMLSSSMFEEFVVPYYQRCYEAFPGTRGLHMCGKIDHLVPVLAEQLRITRLGGFGFPTSPELLTEWFGGKAVMTGGLNPMLLYSGPKEAIKDHARRYIDAFEACGGYVLQDGNNVCPGTPLANLAAVVEASEQYSGERAS